MVTEQLNKGIERSMRNGDTYRQAKYFIVTFVWGIVFLFLALLIGLSTAIYRLYGLVPLLSFGFLIVLQLFLASSWKYTFDRLEVLQGSQQEQINLLAAAVQINSNRTTRIENIFKRLIGINKSKEVLH